MSNKLPKDSFIQKKYKGRDLPAEYNEGVIETLSKALPLRSNVIKQMEKIARIDRLFGSILVVGENGLGEDIVIATMDFKRGLITRAYLCSEFRDKSPEKRLFGKMNRSILNDRVDFKNYKPKFKEDLNVQKD